MNGGGRIEREYGLGRGRTDLLARRPREPGQPSDLRERFTAHRPVPPRGEGGALARRANLRAVDAQFLTIIGTVLAVGFGLAGLMIRTTARLEAHRQRQGGGGRGPARVPDRRGCGPAGVPSRDGRLPGRDAAPRRTAVTRRSHGRRTRGRRRLSPPPPTRPLRDPPPPRPSAPEPAPANAEVGGSSGHTGKTFELAARQPSHPRPFPRDVERLARASPAAGALADEGARPRGRTRGLRLDRDGPGRRAGAGSRAGAGGEAAGAEALRRWDTNGDGRITCKEARQHSKARGTW